jgi:Transmembrane domain of unknown function (DUF3566)
VTDSDVGDRPPRSPYARPQADAQADAQTESHSFLIDPPPEIDPPDDDDAKPELARMSGTSTSGPAQVAWPTDNPGGSLASPTVDRPRAVQVAVARRGPRRARLVIKHIDPWTVMKISFVVSIVMLAVIVVAVAVIYGVLGKMGVWTQINTLVNEVSPTTTSTALRNPLSASRVVGIAAVIGAVNVVLLTALSTLGAAIYNLISDLVGGVEVTLTDP